MMRKIFIFVLAAVFMSGVAAYAHHSYAATYDVGKEVKVMNKYQANILYTMSQLNVERDYVEKSAPENLVSLRTIAPSQLIFLTFICKRSTYR